MTPYERVREEFNFPFELYPFQIEEINNNLYYFDRNGLYWEPGLGKTAGVTHLALHRGLEDSGGLKVKQWVIIMPPILTLQWERWLRSITSKRTCQPLSVTVYKGTPKQRASLDLNAQFVLMSYGILRNDFERLMAFYEGKDVGVICDEGHAVKNSTIPTHKCVKALAQDRGLSILTGTPLTKPIDAYGYVKLISPIIYRNLRQFELIHVGSKDEYGTVISWNRLDLLANNMKVGTSRMLRREVQAQLPPITYTLVPYELDPQHQKLYKRIASEKLVEFEDGREINAISTQALYSALQQIIINWAHFDDNDERVPAALDLVDEVFEEIGPDAKLVVVANFIRSNRYLLEKLKKYGAVAIYGEVSSKGKQEALRKFTTEKSCRCIILQPQSAGFGIDGLQHVCSDILILEAPTTAPPFQQVIARLDRDGQVNPVNCRIGVANKTVQVRMFGSLLENDAMINSVQGGYKDLKDAIYGD